MSESRPEIWREPVRGGFPEPGFYSLSGIEQMRAYQQMLVPREPLGHLIGTRLTQIGSGRAVMSLPATPWLQLPDGSIDLCMLADQAMSVAVLTGAPAGTDVRLSALSVNQLRPTGLESETILARARVLNSGRTFTFAEVFLEDALGRAAAHASGSFLLRPLSPPPPPSPAGMRPVAEPAYPTPDPYLRPGPSEVFPDRIYEDEPGLAVLQKLVRGELVPFPASMLMGFRFVDAAGGAAASTMPATRWLSGAHGVVAPGALAFMANVTLGGTIATLAPAGRRAGLLGFGASFLRGAAIDGRELLARAKVIRSSDDLHVATAEITDADGRTVVHAYVTAVLVEYRRARRVPEPERVLATVLFTDIVGSSENAERLGDAEWRRVMEEHNALTRRELGQFRGREIKTAGDGFLATFDSPTRAVQCARAIRDSVRRLHIEMRAGLHVGEYELLGSDIGGIAVHVASRVQAAAAPGEILVSGTVRDAVAGSGLRFADRGTHSLKGIEGDWRLYAVEE